MRTEEYILEKLKEFKLDISKIGSAKREVALLPTILGDSEELLNSRSNRECNGNNCLY